jgi:dephospho-CoA kinase
VKRPRIAITGGIAEGKSTVIAQLRSMGFPTCSADEIVRPLLQTPEVETRIASLTGLPIPLDRRAVLRSIVDSASIRRSVNRVLHGPVAEAISRSDAIFYEIPLLVETCLQASFDQIWVVTCGESEQVRRLRERYGVGWEALIASQLPSRAKLPFGDVTIRTNQPIETVRRILSDVVSSLSVESFAREE